jgi:hypothetical protein
MTSERSITLKDSPQVALQRSARALQLAGHEQIETNGAAMMVSSFTWKRAMGQIPSMQRNGISITLVPVDEGVEATVLATDGTAQANLLIGSSPAERAVNEVVGFLTWPARDTSHKPKSRTQDLKADAQALCARTPRG